MFHRTLEKRFDFVIHNLFVEISTLLEGSVKHRIDTLVSYRARNVM